MLLARTSVIPAHISVAGSGMTGWRLGLLLRPSRHSGCAVQRRRAASPHSAETGTPQSWPCVRSATQPRMAPPDGGTCWRQVAVLSGPGHWLISQDCKRGADTRRRRRFESEVLTVSTRPIALRKRHSGDDAGHVH